MYKPNPILSQIGWNHTNPYIKRGERLSSSNYPTIPKLYPVVGPRCECKPITSSELHMTTLTFSEYYKITSKSFFMFRPVWPVFYVPPGMTGGKLCFRVVRPSVRLSVRPSVRPSHFRGTTLRASPIKNYAFSTNYHACIAMPTWPRCAPLILCWPWPPYNLLSRSCLTWIFFVTSLMGTTLRAAPSKSYAFSTNYHACIGMPTWPRCAPPILCWPWPPYNLLARSCLTWIFFVDPHWWVPLCVQRPAKSYACSTNYHACIAMSTWSRCAPPILFWPWPPYNLLLRSCLTWIFFRWS